MKCSFFSGECKSVAVRESGDGRMKKEKKNHAGIPFFCAATLLHFPEKTKKQKKRMIAGYYRKYITLLCVVFVC